MSYREAISRTSPVMPKDGGDGVQVLGHWGPHRETSITDTDGSTVTTRNDTVMVSLGATPTDLSTHVMADGSAGKPYLIPGAIYEISVCGARLGLAAFFAMEWTNIAGGNVPAPTSGDFAWPFCAIPQFVFVAKEGQERLSLYLNKNGETINGATSGVFGTVANYLQMRRLT